MWGQAHIRPKNENMRKKIIPFKNIYIILMLSFFKYIFQGILQYLDIGFLDYTPKIGSSLL